MATAKQGHTNVWAALVAARQDFGRVELDGMNPHFRNRYATLGALMAATQPALTANGIWVDMHPVACDNGIAVGLVLRHADSDTASQEYVQCVPVDKSNAQGHGSAISYARRYLYQTVLGLVGEEEDDGNAAAASAPKRAEQPKAQPAPEPQSKPKAVTLTWDNPEEVLFLPAADIKPFASEDDAIRWGLQLQVFGHENHARNGYVKVKRECAPKSALDMAKCWIEYVAGKVNELAADDFDVEAEAAVAEARA